MTNLVINVAPELKYRIVWRTGHIDFEVEMTHGHLVQTSTGVRGGSAKQFEYEFNKACDDFREWMQKDGATQVPIQKPLADAAIAKGKAVRKDFICDGPFLPHTFASSQAAMPRGGDDNEVLPRRRERSLADTGGRVEYRLAGLFLVKEHIVPRIVKRDENPELYAAIKNGKKENGRWIPKSL